MGITHMRDIEWTLCQPFEHVDTNMKEMRFAWVGEVWRVAFAFDPERKAILLVGGDKGGADQRRFYKRLIAVADERFDEYLATLKISKKER